MERTPKTYSTWSVEVYGGILQGNHIACDPLDILHDWGRDIDKVMSLLRTIRGRLEYLTEYPEETAQTIIDVIELVKQEQTRG